jgi:hypothetical protein
VSARSGFTLVEVAVALVLGLMVGALVHRLLIHGQRLARAQGEQMALSENVRAAALVLAGELRGLGYDEITADASAALGHPPALRSDLLAIAPGAVTYLAGRGGGLVCGAMSGPSPAVVIAASSWESLRSPRATDSLLVFVESDPGTGSDDAWIHLGVVSAGAGSCPAGEPAVVLQVAVPAPLSPTTLAAVTPGSPARLAEVMEMRYYRSEGRSWLGMRSVSTGESITPVAGPLADSSAGVRGLTLVYRDAAGGPTSDPAAVRAIEIALLGVTEQPIYSRSAARPAVDSLALSTRVALRNAPRP